MNAFNKTVSTNFVQPYDSVGVLEKIRAIKEKMRKQRVLMSAGSCTHSFIPLIRVFV